MACRPLSGVADRPRAATVSGAAAARTVAKRRRARERDRRPGPRRKKRPDSTARAVRPSRREGQSAQARAHRLAHEQRARRARPPRWPRPGPRPRSCARSGEGCAGAGWRGARRQAGHAARAGRPARRRRSAKRAASSALWVTSTRIVCSRCVQLEEQVGHRGGGGGVEVAGGLVAEQQPRPEHEGAGQGHPLPLAARELRRPMVEALGEADARPSSSRAALPRGRPDRARRRPGPPASARARSRAPSTGRAGSGPGRRSRPRGCGRPRARASGRAKGSRPKRVTVPAVGGSRAPSTFRSVLLPLPEGPITQSAWPGARLKVTPSRMGSGPRGVS